MIDLIKNFIFSDKVLFQQKPFHYFYSEMAFLFPVVIYLNCLTYEKSSKSGKLRYNK